jgi:signal transduction histidine kinase
MDPTSLNTLTHLAGFGAGIALYGLLAVMTRRAPRLSGGERLSFATALLGLAWNAGALVVFGVEDLGAGRAPGWISVVAYGALGFLPAVAVHAVSAYREAPMRRALIIFAYGISSVAASWHLVAMLQGAAVPARAAMLLLTGGNLLLIVGLLVLGRGTRAGRQLSTVALAVFAVMALHLSSHAESPESWLTALLGHHASLPLALAILYQDYRFALADVFLKRALTIVALASVAAVLLWGLALPMLGAAGDGEPERTIAILTVLSLWVVTALLAPIVMRGIARFVDRVLLRRRESAEVLEPLAATIRRVESIDEVLSTGTRALSDALTARVSQSSDVIAASPHPAVTLETQGTRAQVVVPTAEAPSFALVVEDLAGGRRLLSEDRALIEAVATLLGRRIDALRVARERLERDLREESLHRLTSEAELQALRAQLQPHFLFNALTTLGHLMQAAPERAQATLYRLTSLLRAVLQRSAGEQTTLGEELGLVEDYLAIESARFEERLTVEVVVPTGLREARVPPLVLQTLVENAIKHGISPLARGGSVSVRAHAESGLLLLEVRDTGRGTATPTHEVPAGDGVGLLNLSRRLERLYGAAASLRFESAPDAGTVVEVRIPSRHAGTSAWRIAS